jgi:hypothetical protein
MGFTPCCLTRTDVTYQDLPADFTDLSLIAISERLNISAIALITLLIEEKLNILSSPGSNASAEKILILRPN